MVSSGVRVGLSGWNTGFNLDLRSYVQVLGSLWASSPEVPGGVGKVWKRDCNHVSELWISASKKWTQNADWLIWSGDDVIFPLRSDWADFKSTPLGCKGYWAGKRKKKAYWLVWVIKRLHQKMLIKAVSVDVNNQENWTKQFQQCLQKICVRHYVCSLS